MAKSRKHGASRHERLLGTMSYGQGHVTSTDIPELGEDDVWSLLANDIDDDHGNWGNYHVGRSSGGGNGVDQEASVRTRQWLAKEDRYVGGLSLAFEESGQSPSRVIHQFRNVDSSAPPRGSRHHHDAASAPVNVPDWPRILRVDSSESLQWSTEPDGDDEVERMPPHEYLAREYAMSGQMVSTSVLEGVGRTLKGRDMSRVRNAVWRQTGFFG